MLEVGQPIGSYRILRKLGEGGMGAVFEAVHQTIGRRAAIKVLHPQFALDAQIANRFLNEARAASAVEHPGIVEVFEFNQLPDGTTYLVMEFLRGESLASLLVRTGKVPVPDALRLARQIASPLAAAHEKGIVHRDLKPANVMLITDPEALGGTRVKIVDFGIAKLANLAGSGGDHQMTKTGAVMGTPAYMAPEQYRGAGQVDAKADVYALGIMLYECLMARLPFVGEGLGEIIAMHMFTPPPPLEQMDQSLPTELVQLVHAMLAKRPEERPGMGQVVAQLEQLGAVRASQPEGVLHPVAIRGPRGTEVLGASGSPSSTLGQSAAQLGARPPQQGTQGHAALFAGLAAIVVLLAGGGTYLHKTRGSQPEVAAASPPQPAAATALVCWSIASDPTGAQVVRKEDGAVLGITPWQDERPKATGATTLLLRREGHAEKQIVLANDRTLTLNERLQPLRLADTIPVQEPQVRQPRPRNQKPPVEKPENHERPNVQLLPD